MLKMMLTCLSVLMSVCIVLSSSIEREDGHSTELHEKIMNIVESILNERNCKQPGAEDTDSKLTEEIEHLRNKMTLMELRLAQQSKIITELQKLQNNDVMNADKKIVNDNESTIKDSIVNSAENDFSTKSHPMSVERLMSGGRRVRRAVVGGIAFSAYLTVTNSHAVVGHAIKFDQVLLNDGQGYNKYNGAFTAPLTGVYLFSFTFDARKLTFVRLVVNGVNQVDAVANAHTNAESRHAQSMGGNTAIIHVEHGQAVIVETYEIPDSETASSNTFRLCSFSGVLLY